MVRFAQFGAGRIGVLHARNIAQNPRASLSHIVDINAAAAGEVAKATGAKVSDRDAALADPNVDAVLICSATPTHVELMEAAVAAGKPVLCEKPLAASIAECEQVIEAEQKAGRRLVQVGFMRRFDPAYVDMKQRHAEGGLGNARLLHCIHRNASAPVFFKGLMIITNAAVHEFDICRWLLEAEITRIHVHRSRPTAAGAAAFEDPLLIALEMDRGQLVDIEVYVNCGYGYDIRTELVCDRGTLTMLPPHLSELRQAGGTAFAFAPDWRQRFRDAYRLQACGWRDSILSGRPVGASAWDGMVATIVAEAGCRALETGQGEAISLPPRPAFYA